MPHAEPCVRLEWDSAWFGIPIARLRATTVTPDDAHRAAAWARAQQIACVYALVDTHDASSRSALAGAGFTAVDTRLTMRRAVTSVEPVTTPDIRDASPADLDTLAALARTSHRNTRFHVDGRFDPDRSDELYARWIRQAATAQDARVFVATQTGAVVGYLALDRIGQRESQIGLIAVASAARGLGLGGRLVAQACQAAALAGATHVRVVTQGGNLDATAFYEAVRFTAVASETWYHGWF